MNHKDVSFQVSPGIFRAFLPFLAFLLTFNITFAQVDGPWTVLYTVSVDEEPPVAFPLNITAIPGGYRYSGGGGEPGFWATLVNVSITFDAATSEYSATGIMELKNLRHDTRRFESNFILSACPVIDGPTFTGGMTRMQFISGSAGGSLVVRPGESGFELLHDGQLAGAAFSAPFFITASGAGSVIVNGNFGLPVPSLSSPPLRISLAMRQRFDITEANTARLLLTRVASAPSDAHDVLGCGGVSEECDLNGDGVVDFLDLLVMLSFWGPCGSCPADLTGSGAVGFADLTALLACWSMEVETAK